MSTLNDILAGPDSRGNTLRRALREAIRKPLALDAGDHCVIVMERIARGESVANSDLVAALSRDAASRPPAAANIAVIPMRGICLYDFEYPGVCFSTRRLARTVTAAANDPAISTVVIDCDSPGGSCTGVIEAADAVFAASKKKQVISIVSPRCASAAYWICSQSNQVIAVPSSDCGSIGVFMLHLSHAAMLEKIGLEVTYLFAAEHKVEGNPDEKLSESAKRHFQSEVDAIFSDFQKAVARGRKTTVQDVFDNYGKGRCLSAKDSMRCGMIDAVARSPEHAFEMALQPSLMRAAKLNASKDVPIARSDATAARRRRLDLLKAQATPRPV